MKTITFFICSLGSGGSEHQLCTLASLLKSRGYNVNIVTFADVADHYKVDEGIKRIRLGENKGNTGKFMNIFKFFLSLKADVVISFGQRENVYTLLPLLFRKGIKVIAGERNCTIGEPSKNEKLLVKYLYKRANYIVPNSYSQLRHLNKCNEELRPKLKAITNYTDLNLYKAYHYPEHKTIKIGVFARYTTQKNYFRFLDAIKIVKDKVTIPFIIECYGNQTFKDKSVNPYYARLKEKVEEYGLNDVFKLNDHVKNVAELLPIYDAIALPSIHEGFSNSISEAICCSRPMLVSNVSDNSVMVHDGENGFLFDPRNIDDMAIAFIKFLFLGYDERKEMSKNSRLIAESLFNKDDFVNKYIELIEN